MYVAPAHRDHVRRWRLEETLAWRARWAFLAVAAGALIGLGYAREAAGSPPGQLPVAGETVTVTVAPGDTLWDIAGSRYPDADVRLKVSEIEQLNGLNGPAIQPGQHLRLPAR